MSIIPLRIAVDRVYTLELVNKCVTETVGEVSNISIDSENHGIHGIVSTNAHSDLTLFIRAHSDLPVSIRAHSDLTVSIRAYSYLTLSIRDHSDLTLSIRAHSDLTLSIGAHSDLTVSIRAHSDLTLSIRAHYDLTVFIRAHCDLQIQRSFPLTFKTVQWVNFTNLHSYLYTDSHYHFKNSKSLCSNFIFEPVFG